MKGGITIRPARPDDFEGLLALYRHSVKCNAQGFIQDLAFHGDIIERSQRWRETGGDMLVAILDGKVTGLGALAPQNPRSAELCKLHVDPARQGRGIGRRLALSLLRHASDAGFAEVELHVTSTQTAAIALYQSLGFRETARKIFSTTVFGAPASFDTLYMRFILSARAPLARDALLPAGRAAFTATHQS
jgi:ribosomal protein S18 acetylase RimI-like enzyme